MTIESVSIRTKCPAKHDPTASESMRLRVLGAINIRHRQSQGIKTKGPIWTVDTYRKLLLCTTRERKGGVDFEKKSFMNGPLVRASGHVIHAHSPLLPSWKPRTILLCAHCCKDPALVRVRTHTKAAAAAPLQLCRRHRREPLS